jgi:hypothetical protein
LRFDFFLVLPRCEDFRLSPNVMNEFRSDVLIIAEFWSLGAVLNGRGGAFAVVRIGLGTV